MVGVVIICPVDMSALKTQDQMTQINSCRKSGPDGQNLPSRCRITPSVVNKRCSLSLLLLCLPDLLLCAWKLSRGGTDVQDTVLQPRLRETHRAQFLTCPCHHSHFYHFICQGFHVLDSWQKNWFEFLFLALCFTVALLSRCLFLCSSGFCKIGAYSKNWLGLEKLRFSHI